MPHVIEQASSGRAKCRGCGEKIGAGELRFGERLPNPFADEGGEMTHWYHPWCAACRRPEALLEVVDTPEAAALPDREVLRHEAALGVAHHRVPRVNRAERSPTGRATCRACRQLIEKGAWRIGLVFYEDGRFSPGGFVHAGCVAGYFGTPAILTRLRRFTPDLTDSDAAEIAALIGHA